MPSREVLADISRAARALQSAAAGWASAARRRRARERRHHGARCAERSERVRTVLLDVGVVRAVGAATRTPADDQVDVTWCRDVAWQEPERAALTRGDRKTVLLISVGVLTCSGQRRDGDVCEGALLDPLNVTSKGVRTPQCQSHAPGCIPRRSVTFSGSNRAPRKRRGASTPGAAFAIASGQGALIQHTRSNAATRPVSRRTFVSGSSARAGPLTRCRASSRPRAPSPPSSSDSPTRASLR